VIEDKKIIVILFHYKVIVFPDRTHQEITSHGKRKGKDDIVDVPQEEHRQDAVEYKKEFYTRIYTQGIYEGGDDRIKSEIDHSCQFVLLVIVADKNNKADQCGRAGEEPGRYREMGFAYQTGKGQNDPGQQPQKIHDIKDTELPFFVISERGPVPNVPDESPETKKTFYSLVHGQSLRV
jgi:hypothetical protein